MTDATLPILPPSSSQECRILDQSDTNTSENDAFPFLVHSQVSVTNGEPPEVDNGRLARQKRRRTSPQDQATLEAEYKRNPKPDKAARMEIVQHVALGEKEVQIWFQNRRQNTRRKSRPLLPHEIAAFGLGGIMALPSDPSSSFGSSQSGTQPSFSSPGAIDASSQQLNNPDEKYEMRRGLDDVFTPYVSEKNAEVEMASRELATQNPALGSQTSRTTDNAFPQPMTNTLGYLSNRRHATRSLLNSPISSQAPSFTTPANNNPVQPSSCPGRLTTDDSMASSQVRLSLSLDGKAELISTDVSPPRPQHLRTSSLSSGLHQRRLGGLQRSQSALPFATVLRKPSFGASFASIVSSGRSRDARTWEFCCDADARDELTTQAENESSGSALAAISLIRSTSFSALKPNTNKRNAPPLKQVLQHGKKPKLGRASSSVARLQTALKQPVAKSSAKEKTVLTTSPSGDSDKENWVPHDDGGSSQTRRPLPAARPPKQRRQLLEEPTPAPESSLASRKTVLKKSASAGFEILGDEGEPHEDIDDEVKKFMRGEVSPSKKGDLDCIQGLLSLSQGNWR